MGYSIDLSNIAIHKYMTMLQTQNLLPGRRILLENIEDNFRRITAAGMIQFYQVVNSI